MGTSEVGVKLKQTDRALRAFLKRLKKDAKFARKFADHMAAEGHKEYADLIRWSPKPDRHHLANADLLRNTLRLWFDPAFKAALGGFHGGRSVAVGIVVAIAQAFIGILFAVIKMAVEITLVFLRPFGGFPKRKPLIILPPGTRIRRILAWLCRPRTMAHTFDPVLTDLRHEYLEALREKKKVKAFWVRIRGYWSIITAIGLQSFVSVGKKIVAYWRSSSI